MEGIVLGQYVPGNSLLHRLDPRTIPRKAKIISIAVLNFSIVVSIIFVAAHPWLVVTLLLIDFGVSIYILRIPTTESLDIKQPEQVENGLE